MKTLKTLTLRLLVRVALLMRNYPTPVRFAVFSAKTALVTANCSAGGGVHVHVQEREEEEGQYSNNETIIIFLTHS